MFGNAFGWPHLLIILVILLLLFGAPKLPALAKSIAQSMKIFRTEMGPNHDKAGDASSAAPAGPQAAANTADTTVQPTATSTDYPPKQ